MDGFRWDDDPIRLFRDWHRAAARLVGAAADAMTLATATPDGRPSARVVLLKGVDEGRFCFFTNAFSRKGVELSVNSRVASVFFWPQSERQVRVEGRVRALPRARAESYFHTRPLESRLSSHVSPQCPRIGRAGPSSPPRSSSGRAEKAGCITGCATTAGAPAGGAPSWPRRIGNMSA